MCDQPACRENLVECQGRAMAGDSGLGKGFAFEFAHPLIPRTQHVGRPLTSRTISTARTTATTSKPESARTGRRARGGSSWRLGAHFQLRPICRSGRCASPNRARRTGALQVDTRGRRVTVPEARLNVSELRHPSCHASCEGVAAGLHPGDARFPFCPVAIAPMATSGLINR
jgi:hypothetical protein